LDANPFFQFAYRFADEGFRYAEFFRSGGEATGGCDGQKFVYSSPSKQLKTLSLYRLGPLHCGLILCRSSHLSGEMQGINALDIGVTS
jgi:hypothetical protein